MRQFANICSILALYPPPWHEAVLEAHNLLASCLSSGLSYHNCRHTVQEVLPSAMLLAELNHMDEHETALLLLAALFHDTGFVDRYENNEPVAVAIAEKILDSAGLSSPDIEHVCLLILATTMPQRPQTVLEKILCDADLSTFGRDDFLQRSLDLRQELAAHGTIISLADWFRRQLNFLQNHQYFTEAARQLFSKRKEKNRQILLRELKKYE